MTEQSKAKTLIEEARELLGKATPTEEWAQDRFHLSMIESGVYPVAQEKARYFPAQVLYDDNDVCANVEEHLTFGIDGNAMAELFAHAPDLLSSLCNELDTQVSLNEVQAQNIVEFQREQKMFREALREAKEVIKTWHGPDAWDIYDQHSPEMIRINAALEAATKES